MGEVLYECSHPTAVCMIDGVPGEIRTHDLQLRRLSLYPAELLGQLSFQAVQVIEYPRTEWNSRFFSSFNLFFYEMARIEKKAPLKWGSLDRRQDRGHGRFNDVTFIGKEDMLGNPVIRSEDLIDLKITKATVYNEVATLTG